MCRRHGESGGGGAVADGAVALQALVVRAWLVSPLSDNYAFARPANGVVCCKAAAKLPLKSC